MSNLEPKITELEETFKLGVHLGLFGFGVACALYNLGAFMAKKHHHNAMNVGAYTGLVAFEVWQMNIHWKAMAASRMVR